MGSEITINYGKGYFNETEGIELPRECIDESETVQNIIKKYMDKPMFHQIYDIYDNLALADCEYTYHYDDKTILTTNKKYKFS